MKTIDITTYRVNRLLKEKSWTQSDLANRLGVTQQTVQKWVKGKTSPSMENIDKLTDITGLPPFWFMLPPDEQDQISVPESMSLGPEQLEFIRILNSFPKQDQEEIIKEIREKKEKMDEIVARWIEAREGKKA